MIGARRRGLAVAPIRALLGLVLVGGGLAQHAGAQRTVRPDSLRQIQTLSPRVGPVGTEVLVHTANLPLQAAVHVGVGAIGTGFEVLAEAAQGEWGEVSASVSVPAYATWDRPLFFIVLDALFSPIGISEPFHVTSPEGRVLRRGRIEFADGSCPVLRDEHGVFYGLLGSPEGSRPGSRVIVEGLPRIGGPCGPGDVLEVSRFEPIP